jgi:NAD(P)-dependent dehydrogenase (short-subunit alcohol dehydrogenase family)
VTAGQGRVGLLAGTAAGIGRASVLLLADDGAALVALDCGGDEGSRTFATRQAGGCGTFVHGNIPESR